MKIGVVKEIKTAEFRVALTPTGTSQLTQQGHDVLAQASCGVASGFSDDAYRQAGATVVPDANGVWSDVDLVLKVKEPLPSEYPFLRDRGDSLSLFTYLHLAGVEGLASELCEAGTTAIAYETVETADGSFPLLAPMSYVAGRLAIHEGGKFLRRPLGTKGMLLGGGPGIPPARVSVIGAGTVGQTAARLAMANGADVTLINRSTKRLTEFIAHGYPGNLRTMIASPEVIAQEVSQSDLIVSGIYVSGARASRVITRKMIASMEPGSVIVDVAIDQGGSTETSRPTTYEDPVFEVDGVLHYCVANMPGAVPRTSTVALTNETLRFVSAIARKGVRSAIAEDPALARGVNVFGGKLTNRAVADATGLNWANLEDLT